MIKSNVRIGDVVKIGGLELTVKEWSNEMDCVLCRYYCTEECDNMPCKAYKRPDKKNVYFTCSELPDKTIGEEFCYGNATLVACSWEGIGSRCVKCYFRRLPCHHVPCMSFRRADGKAVYYKRIDK